MKKALLTIALVATLGLVANAQPDGFFRNDGNGDNGTRTDISGTTPALPSGGVGTRNDDQPAPLGSGLLILTALGAGYAVTRRREK